MLFLLGALSGAPSRASSGTYNDALLRSSASTYFEHTSKFASEDEYTQDALPLRFLCTDKKRIISLVLILKRALCVLVQMQQLRRTINVRLINIFQSKI